MLPGGGLPLITHAAPPPGVGKTGTGGQRATPTTRPPPGLPSPLACSVKAPGFFLLLYLLVFSPQPQLPKACLSPTAGRVPSTASCLRHGSSNNEEITCISGQQDGGATSAAWICAIAKRLDLRRGGCCSFLVCKEEKIAAKPLLLPRYLMEARIWGI